MPREPVTDTHRWVATALKRAETLVARLRKTTGLDDDWLDEVEGGTHDLFRDLAVGFGFSFRAVDWEGADEPDPLDVIRLAKAFPVTSSKEILAKLLESGVFYTPDNPAKALSLASDAEDAIERLGRLLRGLAKLLTDEEDDSAKGRIDDAITPTEW